MSDFKTIEKEFLAIDPLDKKQLLTFYDRNKDYFKITPSNPDELRKYLWMLTEVGATFSFDHQHKTALPILDKVINLYECNRERLKIKLDDEEGYNSSIWSKGYSLFELKQYFKAKPYFKRIRNIETDNKRFDQLETILRICNWKIKNRVAIVFGVTGLLILIAKYSIKWFSTEHDSYLISPVGFLGGLLIITAGLLYKTKIKHISLTDEQLIKAE